MSMYTLIFLAYVIKSDTFKALGVAARNFIVNEPLKAAITALIIGAPLKYIQRKLRFARINHIKWKFGFTDDPNTWKNMTIEQAQEIEQNMAEVCDAWPTPFDLWTYH